MKLNIVYEDSYIIVAEKPPKVPSQQDKTNDMDMLSMIKEHLKVAYPQARNPYIGLVHRLDRPVGGLMIFAKTKEANAHLSEQMRDKSFKKEYYAVVCGEPENKSGILKDYLLKIGRINMSKVVSKENKNAKEAILEYKVIGTVNTDEDGVLSFVRIKLKTGRHHQIRVQFSNANMPLWGDNKYNKRFVKMKGYTQIALWATSIEFIHPKDKKVYKFESKPYKEYPFSLVLEK
ncbi:RluA family pseudouridine synthase [Tepidibacter mesophilus]|uniref:RluA family pseudouridine synthase n=1 Tax=Tepidibacter mesophilus TaxID=655607 RepID=UPI000C080B2C|nr:RluA family pseudouridine synthase [Tepidibacter mesophilus]